MPRPIKSAFARADSEAKRILDAWGEYLHRFDWHHLAVLTFRSPASLDRAVREVEHRWLRRLAYDAQRAVPCFYAIERGAAGFLHVHALTAGTAGLTIAQLQAAWRAGITKIDRYDESLHGTWYVTKGLFRRCEWYDVTPRRAPLLSAPGCRTAKCEWQHPMLAYGPTAEESPIVTEHLHAFPMDFDKSLELRQT